MTEFRWLIEAPGPRWLAVRELTSMFDFIWSSNHDAALAFRSQEQANGAMQAIRSIKRELFGFEDTLGPARAIEHGYLGESPKGPPRPSRPPDHIPAG